jgi:hypothetical protein
MRRGTRRVTRRLGAHTDRWRTGRSTRWPRNHLRQLVPEPPPPTRPGACTTNSPRGVHNQLVPGRAQPTGPGTTSANWFQHHLRQLVQKPPTRSGARSTLRCCRSMTASMSCASRQPPAPPRSPKGAPRRGAPPSLVSPNARASAGGVPPAFPTIIAGAAATRGGEPLARSARRGPARAARRGAASRAVEQHDTGRGVASRRAARHGARRRQPSSSQARVARANLQPEHAAALP